MSAECPKCGEASTARVDDNPVDQALMTYECSNGDCSIYTFIYRNAGWIG